MCAEEGNKNVCREVFGAQVPKYLVVGTRITIMPQCWCGISFKYASAQHQNGQVIYLVEASRNDEAPLRVGDATTCLRRFRTKSICVPLGHWPLLSARTLPSFVCFCLLLTLLLLFFFYQRNARTTKKEETE